MNIEIVPCQTEHAKEIAEICANWWQQTVEGQLSKEYQEKRSIG